MEIARSVADDYVPVGATRLRLADAAGLRVGDRVVVERGGCIAAGAWVEPGTVVPAGWIWAGRPARAFRQLKPAEREEFARARDIYVTYSRDYRKASAA
jgi:carbonic anhydrase/acetyltransferase-like protein (isoleucine patch superfamily)